MNYQKIMKIIILAFSVLFSLSPVYGQKDSADFFFNEFGLSLNRTERFEGKLEQELGFGIGAYRSMWDQKRIPLIFGMEYNLNRLFMDQTYEGHFAHATDVQYTIHNWSFSFGCRFMMGKKIKPFIELGTFLDLIIGSRREGMMHTYFPGTVYKDFSFNENAGLSSHNYGLSGGIGIKIPVDNREVTFKSDYKIGFQELNSSEMYFYMRYFRLAIALSL